MKWELINVCAVTPDTVIYPAGIVVNNEHIESVYEYRNNNYSDDIITLDIQGMIAYPGLINAHDHLIGTYYPRVGDRRPYLNWLMWDNDLKASPHYQERQQIEAGDLYLLGAYRNLITGITTVQDHIPHSLQDTFKDTLPIKIADKYALAHSVTSFALPWGNGFEAENKLSITNNIPFITHCSEGFDNETKNSVEYLYEIGALHENTVLIHGIAFSNKDLERLAKAKANVVWCPVSNLFMFEKTTPIKKLLDMGINVALGTDSPMSGSINLFEEIFIAKQYYEANYKLTLSDKTILNMLTKNPAKALNLKDVGYIKNGYKADLLILKAPINDPYKAISEMTFENIMLVTINGKPKYADYRFKNLFEAMNITYETMKVASSKKIIVGSPVGLLEKIRQSVKFHKELPFLPIERL